jgi:pyruvate,orthophosphate dikinase
MSEKWVYLFEELEQAEAHVGGSWEAIRSLFGGKGANMAEMKRIGVPVPPGFTVTTEACNDYLASGGMFPKGLWEQVMEAMTHIEQQTGKAFGQKDQPLLVSCRSGAKFSMPGMMDTVLNIGLNPDTVEGMVNLTSDERFVYDLYRRLLQMFGSVVMEMPDEVFEDVITAARKDEGVSSDTDISAAGWKKVSDRFKRLFLRHTRHEFPDDPYQQLKLAIEAVFKSWNGKRAVDYRAAAGIPNDLGTAVNIVTMVYGNMGNTSATGVAMTRNGSTGEKRIEGDYLINAQGEDVVAGIRLTEEISKLGNDMPEVYEELLQIADRLETHYREMQDVEFTVENGRLWMLQTRDGKRTAQAAVRIAVEMCQEGLITREEAVLRVTPEQVDFFLHPQFDLGDIQEARSSGRLLAKGLNVSPGAAVGVVAMDADLAEKWAKEEQKDVIMVRPETKPDDVHGMLAAHGILTSRGGRTSHAALVARQFGKPAVVGVSELEIDAARHQMTVNGKVIHEGDWLSIDGTAGNVYVGQLKTTIPDIKDPWLMKLLSWADSYRRLGVWANADYPRDAQRAREYGAEGIGLCRTEHMFFEAERQPLMQKMILSERRSDRLEALEELLPYQLDDFAGLFRVMQGDPVIIRLLDPPLHEFLPIHGDLVQELSDIKIQLQHAQRLSEINALLQQFETKSKILKRVEVLHEANPMLGTRGVRLGIQIPEITTMQVRAIFEAAVSVVQEGIAVKPEIMIPLTCHVNELKVQRDILEAEARTIMEHSDIEVDYKFGTMIEIPRAALTADEIAKYAEFFSFGTNDLTQTTFGISRDDAEAGFLIHYMESGVLDENPFDTLDRNGVGALMQIAVTKGREAKKDLECGICGEHGGDPRSIELCHHLGLNYVSCSPFRVPIARLAAAHAALREKT